MSIRHTYITKSGHETKDLTPLKAIRQKCLDCSAWQREEIKLCPAKDCALFPFRFGKIPNHKAKGRKTGGNIGALSKWRENLQENKRGMPPGN